MLRLRWVALMLAVAFFHEDIKDVVKPLILISKKVPPYIRNPTRKIVPGKAGLAFFGVYPGPNPTRGDFRPVVETPSTDKVQPGGHTVNYKVQTETTTCRAKDYDPPDTLQTAPTPGRTHLADITAKETTIPTDKEKETLLVPDDKRLSSCGIVQSNILDEAGVGQKTTSDTRGNNVAPGAASQHLASSAVVKPDGHEATPVVQDMMRFKTDNKMTRDQTLAFLQQLKEDAEDVGVSDDSTSDEAKLSATIIGLRPIYTREPVSKAPGSNATLKEEEIEEENTFIDSLWNVKVSVFAFIWTYGFEFICFILYSTIMSRMLYIRKYYKLSVKEYEKTLGSTRSFLNMMRKETKLHRLKQDRLNRTWDERQSLVNQEKEELEELLSNIQEYVIEDEGSGKMKCAQDDFNLMSEHLSINALEGLDNIGKMDRLIRDLWPVTEQLRDELLLWESIVVERKDRSQGDKKKIQNLA